MRLSAADPRSWKGKGFNLIWRPHDGSSQNPKDFFLELDLTEEKLSFKDLTGVDGIANRGLREGTIALGGLAYTQEVSDIKRNPRKALHFEPGVWVNVPATKDPAEEATVARMGSIPHGTTIHAQGRAFDAPKPIFTPSSIMPFTIGSPDDGVTGLVTFPEARPPLSQQFTSRTLQAAVTGLTDAQFSDPSLFLSDAIKGQNIIATKVFVITTNVQDPNMSQAPAPGIPNAGGGIDNIAFLEGSGGRPNADAAKMTATFWVETVKRKNGTTFEQLQYMQRILLNFNGLSWPHVSVATLRGSLQPKS